MTTAQFNARLAAKWGKTAKETDRLLDAFKEVMTEEMVAGARISFQGFMTFSTKKRAARKGVNPQTGKKINIPAKTVVDVNIGKRLKDAVNQ